MVAAAHSVTLDAGRASPLFTVDDRHSVQTRPNAVVAGGYRQPSGREAKRLRAEQNETRRRTASHGEVWAGGKVYKLRIVEVWNRS